MADVERQVPEITHDVRESQQFIASRIGNDANESSQNSTEEKTPAATEHKPNDTPRPTTFNPGNIPNGGTQAWIQVLGGFCLFFNTWGFLNCFGIFQTYYETGQLFQATSSNISWIGAIQAYFLLLGGLVSGPIYDRGYLRVLLIVGSFGVVFGHMMLSLCHTYWQVLLAQGFCVGLGAGCLYVPALAILPTYFNTKLGLAVGIAASGGSFGGVIYPIVFYQLIDQIGYAWSVRVLGFIALVTLLLPIFCSKMRVKPAKPRDVIDWSAFTDWPYMTFVFGAMIGFIGLYVFFFYISYYGEATRITDASLSFYLIPILNAASMFGRTLPNALADKTGAINLIAPGAFVCGLLIFCMLAVKSVAATIIMASLFGFFSGVFIALPPLCLVALTKDKSKIGTRIGMGFAMIGFSALAGGPGGGRVLATQNGLNWTGLWVYGGIAECVAGAIFFALRMWKTGPKLKVKC